MTADGHILKLIADLLAANERLAEENAALRGELESHRDSEKPGP